MVIRGHDVLCVFAALPKVVALSTVVSLLARYRVLVHLDKEFLLEWAAKVMLRQIPRSLAYQIQKKNLQQCR